MDRRLLRSTVVRRFADPVSFADAGISVPSGDVAFRLLGRGVDVDTRHRQRFRQQ
jgi:hypothetical protein